MTPPSGEIAEGSGARPPVAEAELPVLRAGDRLGRLRIEQALGGAGTLYQAWDDEIGRRVVVRFVVGGWVARRREVLRAGGVISVLAHPGMVTIYEVGDHQGAVYVVMEHVEGEGLEAWIDRRGPVAPVEAVDLIGQIADAITAVREAGIVDGEIGAAQVRVDVRGRARLVGS